MTKVMDEANRLLKERGYLDLKEFDDLIKKYGKKIVIKFDEEKGYLTEEEVSDEIQTDSPEFIDFSAMSP